MTDNTQKKIRAAKENRLRRLRFYRVGGVLAAVAVFVTAYALIRPAVTMENEALCGYVQHEHTGECYSNQLTCTDEGHEHTAECYSTVLTCTIPEHTHTDACYSDPTRVETAEDISDKYLKDVALTEDISTDVTTVAQAMVGYAERDDNYEVLEDGTHKGYTFFGDAEDAPYADWNTLFATYCLEIGGVEIDAFFGEDPVEPQTPEDGVLLSEATCEEYAQRVTDAGYYTAEATEAAVGDLAFVDVGVEPEDGDALPEEGTPVKDGKADRVGIITKIENGYFTVIEGDTAVEDGQDCVKECVYPTSELLGFGLVSQYSASIQESASLVSFSALAEESNVMTVPLAMATNNESSTSSSEGGAFLDKTIKANEDGSFTLRLSAYVTGEKVVTYSYDPVDVVLILDTSGSMNYDDAENSAGDQVTRMAALQEAADNFVSTIAANQAEPKDLDGDGEEEDRPSRVAVVEFNYWRTLTYTSGGKSYTGGTNKVIGLTDVDEQVTTNGKKVSSVVNAVNTLAGIENTNTEPFESFNIAYNILYQYEGQETSTKNTEEVNTEILLSNDPSRKKIVVFFTDGMPGSRVDAFGYDSGNVYDTEYKNHDVFSAYDNINRTVTNANKIKQAGGTIYTVGVFKQSSALTTSSPEYRFMDAVSSDNSGDSMVNTICNVTKTSHYLYNSWNFTGTIYAGYPNGRWGGSSYDNISNCYTYSTANPHPYMYASNSATSIEGLLTKTANEIVSLSRNLDETTIMKDVLTPEFTMESNDTAKVIDMYTQKGTMDANGNITWADEYEAIEGSTILTSKENPTAEILSPTEAIANKEKYARWTINVTGFDYSTHWVGVGNDKGCRLVVDIKIQSTTKNPGLGVNSNEATSGLYDGNGNPVKSFDPPKVEFPNFVDVVVQGSPGYATVTLPADESNRATFVVPYNTTDFKYEQEAFLIWKQDTSKAKWGGKETLTVNPVSGEDWGTSSTVRVYSEANVVDDSTTKEVETQTFTYTMNTFVPTGYNITYQIFRYEYGTVNEETGELPVTEVKLWENGVKKTNDTVTCTLGAATAVLNDNKEEIGKSCDITIQGDGYYKIVITLTRNPVFEFTKVTNDKPLSRVEFTVTHDDTSCTCADDAAYSGVTYTAVSGTDGKVTFSSLTPGHTYIMTETVPTDYTAEYESYQITANSGGYTVVPIVTEGSVPDSWKWTGTVENAPKKVTYTVNIVVYGDSASSVKFPFVVSYEGDGGVSPINASYGDGESFTVSGIPYRADVTIGTSQYDGYHLTVVENKDTGDVTQLGDSVSSTATKDTTYTFTFTEGTELPHTGGGGIAMYTFGGAAMMAAAVAGCVVRRKRERRFGS